MFVSLIVEIEERWGIEIPAAYLNIDNLENNINSYLYDLCGINILSNTLTFNSGIFLLFIGIFISLILSIFISNKITNLNVSLILKED